MHASLPVLILILLEIRKYKMLKQCLFGKDTIFTNSELSFLRSKNIFFYFIFLIHYSTICNWKVKWGYHIDKQCNGIQLIFNSSFSFFFLIIILGIPNLNSINLRIQDETVVSLCKPPTHDTFGNLYSFCYWDERSPLMWFWMF